MRTQAGVCQRKRRFASEDEALAVVASASVKLRSYRCDLCRHYHLTSRTKGMQLPRSELQRRQRAQNPEP